MAGTYEIVSAAPVTILTDSGEALERIEVYMRSKPSGVIVPLRIRPQLYDPPHVDLYCRHTAAAIEAVAQLQGVLAMVHTQTVNPGGALADQMYVYVESESGSSDAPLIYPLSAFVTSNLIAGGPAPAEGVDAAVFTEPPTPGSTPPGGGGGGTIADQVAAAVANLNAVEAL
jgi:hypothetical protein